MLLEHFGIRYQGRQDPCYRVDFLAGWGGGGDLHMFQITFSWKIKIVYASCRRSKYRESTIGRKISSIMLSLGQNSYLILGGIFPQM